jgi:hypothetical protein
LISSLFRHFCVGEGFVFGTEWIVGEEQNTCIKPTMKLFQSVALPKSLVPQAFLQKEKG